MSKHFHKLLLFLLLVNVCLYAAPSDNLGADDSVNELVTISGVVINETLPEIPVEVAPVTLYINGLGDEVESLHTLTGTDGAFEFKEVRFCH